MRPRDRELVRWLDAELLVYEQHVRPLPGISSPVSRGVFLEQLLESIHRIAFIKKIQQREISRRRCDPNDDFFDPLKAAIIQMRDGNTEEAFWLVFLFVHFGKHRRAGWRYAREVYSGLGQGVRWDWPRISAAPAQFRTWLHSHRSELDRGGVPRGFGNHRKYESLDAYSARGTGAAVETYVVWIGPPRTHQELMLTIYDRAHGDSRRAFDDLYQSMSAVASFGRTARFDYLTMVGKLGLAPIEPGSTYMHGSTGPGKGARLMFGVRAKDAELDEWLVQLDRRLKVGMQVLEDALCNWQKSPSELVRFRG